MLVHGKGNIGKARFVLEICQFFHMHNKFRHVIFFHDLSTVNSEQDFRALIAKLNFVIKSKKEMQQENFT